MHPGYVDLGGAAALLTTRVGVCALERKAPESVSEFCSLDHMFLTSPAGGASRVGGHGDVNFSINAPSSCNVASLRETALASLD